MESGVLLLAANFADTPPMVFQYPLSNTGLSYASEHVESQQSSIVVIDCSYQSISVAPADFEMVSNADSYGETEEQVDEYDPVTLIRRRVRYNR